MNKVHTIVAVAALSAAAVCSLRFAHAQGKPVLINPVTIDTRVATLEQEVATLKAENAQLLSVIQIGPDGSFTVNSRGLVNIKSASALTLSGTSAVSIGGGVISTTGTQVSIKGQIVSIN